MIDALRTLFQRAFDAADGDDPARALERQRLAVASLLVEMIRADHVMGDAEQAAVRRALQAHFELTPDEVEELLEAAHDRARDATSLFEFTHLLNRDLDHASKVQVVQMLWQVAYSDGELERHEAHLVRKVADLLHVRHREYIGAKLRAAGEDAP